MILSLLLFTQNVWMTRTANDELLNQPASQSSGDEKSTSPNVKRSSRSISKIPVSTGKISVSSRDSRSSTYEHSSSGDSSNLPKTLRKATNANTPYNSSSNSSDSSRGSSPKSARKTSTIQDTSKYTNSFPPLSLNSFPKNPKFLKIESKYRQSKPPKTNSIAPEQNLNNMHTIKKIDANKSLERREERKLGERSHINNQTFIVEDGTSFDDEMRRRDLVKIRTFATSFNMNGTSKANQNKDLQILQVNSVRKLPRATNYTEDNAKMKANVSSNTSGPISTSNLIQPQSDNLLETTNIPISSVKGLNKDVIANNDQKTQESVKNEPEKKDEATKHFIDHISSESQSETTINEIADTCLNEGKHVDAESILEAENNKIKMVDQVESDAGEAIENKFDSNTIKKSFTEKKESDKEKLIINSDKEKNGVTLIKDPNNENINVLPTNPLNNEGTSTTFIDSEDDSTSASDENESPDSDENNQNFNSSSDIEEATAPQHDQATIEDIDSKIKDLTGEKPKKSLLKRIWRSFKKGTQKKCEYIVTKLQSKKTTKKNNKKLCISKENN